MLTPTHLIAAQTTYFGACIAMGHPPAPVEAVVAALGSLLPDLDHRQSLVGRAFPFLSIPLEHWAGHRALTHSLAVQVALGVLAWFCLPFGFFLPLLAGWVSHSLCDMMTPSGVAWFWPSRVRCVLPGNAKYRMVPMGSGELAFAVVLAASGVVLLSLARAGEGTAGLIRSAIGDIAAAREQYDAEKGRNAWVLRLEGRDNRSYEGVDGSYPVIGPWKEAGFILESESGPRTACRSSACDWYADHAVLVKGEPEITTTTTITAERIGTGSLSEPLARLESTGRVYLLGTLTAKGIRPEEPTVTVTGETVHLAYATPAELAAWPSMALRDVDLTVQVRHAPGTVIPQMPGPVGEKFTINPLLERWIGETQGSLRQDSSKQVIR